MARIPQHRLRDGKQTTLLDNIDRRIGVIMLVVEWLVLPGEYPSDYILEDTYLHHIAKATGYIHREVLELSGPRFHKQGL